MKTLLPSTCPATVCSWRCRHQRMQRQKLRCWPWLIVLAMLSPASLVAQTTALQFANGSDEHYFPTTLGKYTIADVDRFIPAGADGVYSVTFEVLATGYWPGQLGFIYGLAGYPLVDTGYHDLGMREDEWGYRGRDGSVGAEGSVTALGSALQYVGDQIRIRYDAGTQVVSVFTKRTDQSEFTLEGGREAFTEVVAEGGRELKFAVSGICWQPCGVKIVASEWPVQTEGALSAAAGVTEPVALSASATSDADAVNLLDFSLSDGGADYADLAVDSVSLQVSGTLDPAKLAFRLNGPDVSDAVGSWDSNTQRLTFTDLSIAVASDEPHTYTLSAWFTDTSGLSNGQTLQLSLASEDIVVADGSSLMIAGDAVSNGAGSVLSGVNAPPAVDTEIADQLAVQDQVFTLNTAGNFSDADNDDLTFSATGLPDGFSMSSAGVISGTPELLTVADGPYSITVSASDGTDSASTSFELRMRPASQPANPSRDLMFSNGSDEYYFPTTLAKYSIVDVDRVMPTGDEGVYSVTFEVLATGYWPGQTGFNFGLAGYPLFDTDQRELGTRGGEWAFRGRDGRTITGAGETSYEGSTSVFGARLNQLGEQLKLSYDAATKEVSIYSRRAGESEFSLEGGRPAFADVIAGEGRELKFAVSGICFQLCGVKIVASEWPVQTEGALSTAAGVSEPVALSASTTSDADAVNLLDFSLSDGGADYADLVVDSVSLQVSGTLDPAKLAFRLNGPDVSDAVGSWDSDAQRLTFADLGSVVAHGEPHTYTLSAWFTDTSGLGNGQTLLLSLGSEDVAVADGSSLMVAGASVSNGAGSVLSGVNTAPQASDVRISGTAVEGQTLTGSYQFSDVDNDVESGTVVAWQRAVDASGTDVQTIDGAMTNTFALSSADVGDYLRFLVTPGDGDALGSTVSSAWFGPIQALNRAPEVTEAIADQHVTQGQTLALDVSDSVADPDGDTLTFTASGLPAGLAISAEGVITGTASNAAALGSPYTVTVTAADPSGLSVSSTFALSIANVNDAPVLATTIAQQTATQGVAFTVDVSSNFSDPDGDTLSFSGAGLPDGFVIDNSGVITGTASNAVALGSPYTVTVTATDPAELSVSGSFELMVVNVNDAPVIVTTIDAQTIVLGETFTLDVSENFSDPDGDVLSFSAPDLPDGLSISDEGVISGAVSSTAVAASPITITVTASDDEGSTISQSFDLTVLIPEPVGSVIDNEQADVVITPGTVIEIGGVVNGGQINGAITNRGVITGRVTAAPGAQISGGQINGELEGSPSQPLRLTGATVGAGSRLVNVIIGAGTVLQDGVELGPNVKFQSPDAIPAGQNLTGALQPLQWSDGDARQVPGLDATVVVSDQNADSPSILRAIQLIQGFEPSGNSINQNAGNGVLQADLGDARAAVLPVSVTRGTSDMLPGVSVNEDGDIVLVTVNHDLVLAFPSLPSNQDLEEVLRDAGLLLSFNDRANMVIRSDATDADEQQLQAGRQVQALSTASYFSARPDVLALPAHRSNVEGLHSFADPALANRVMFSLVYRDEAGLLVEQDIVPVPADWLTLKQTLQSLGDVSALLIDTQGVIHLTLDGDVYRARADYEVIVGEPCDEQPEQDVCFGAYQDFNDDGVNDYLLVYPNGDRQVLYVLP